jgi:hypothetical protein
MADAYFADEATLSLETESATSVPIAGLQDLTVIPSVAIEQLYTGDSIKIDAQKQHEFEVQVEIGFSKWDLTLAEEWLGGSGATSTSMSDQNDPQKYTASGDFTSVDGALTYQWEVTGITFEEMPILDFSRGEFIQWDLSGTGEDLTDLSEVV